MTSYRLCSLVCAASTLALALPGQLREREDATPLTETQRIQHVLSRFAFGPTPGMIERVRKIGLDQWFEEQLSGKARETYELGDKLRKFETLELSAQELLANYNPRQPGVNATAKERREYARLRNLPRNELLQSIVYRCVYAGNQVREVATDFWRNHFNVDISKGLLRYYAVEYEREVLRAHVFDRFADLLEGSAKHPAMLVYLDNAVSRRPPTKGELSAVAERARRATGSKERAAEAVNIARQRGLNENYARELLELHTLGADNYYTQRDVVEVARALTGWTVQNNAKYPVGFLFRPDLHVRGEKHFLGQVIRGSKDNPLLEGERILARLERHKGTAHFIATKLCRYFVDDHPGEKIVRRVAAVFLRRKGDLKAVYRALLHDPDFFAPKYYQSKYKRPFEFVVSALRVTGAKIDDPAAALRVMALLQEPLYRQEDPTGYYDTAEAWNDPGVMAVRWQFAFDLATGKLHGIRVPQSFYKGLHPRIPRVWKDQLARRVLPAGMGEKTSRVLDKVMRRYLEEHPKPKVTELGPFLLGLLLGSPEFQRQ